MCLYLLITYTVRYEVKKKAKFTPISLLDSSDEDEEEPIKETPSEAGSEAATPKGLHNVFLCLGG